MLQGFLNENAIELINADINTSFANDILTETIAHVDQYVINESVSKDDVFKFIKHVKDVVVNFFKKIFARIQSKISGIKDDEKLVIPEDGVKVRIPNCSIPPSALSYANACKSVIDKAENLIKSNNRIGNLADIDIYDMLIGVDFKDKMYAESKKIHTIREDIVTPQNVGNYYKMIRFGKKRLTEITSIENSLISSINIADVDNADISQVKRVYGQAIKCISDIAVAGTQYWLTVVEGFDRALNHYTHNRPAPKNPDVDDSI